MTSGIRDDAAADRPKLSVPGAERPSVLLVDDRPENLDALEAILEPLGLRIVRAMSAGEALREVLRNDFAVILLDVKMPDMDGPEAARLIKARARSELVPIIFLTALERDRRRVTAAYASGAVDYLTKPLDADVLRSKVHAFVELHQKREDAAWRQRRRFADLAEQARVDAVREAERRATEILERIADGHIMLDHDWRIVYVNPSAERLLGASKVALVGKTHSDVWPVSAGSKAEHMYRQALSDQVDVHFADHYVADGHAVHLEIDAYPTQERGLAIFWRDVTARIAADTARRASEEQLRVALGAEREARALAEVADRTKSAFLATMSHELRTPLNAIVGYVQLMEMGVGGSVTAQQQEYLARLRASGQHLLSLVNDLLDLAKVEAGHMIVSRENALASAAVEAAVALAKPEAEARGMVLTTRCAPHDDVVYAGDEDRVRQILLNLLSNAIKFSAPGTPVDVECERTENVPPTVRATGAGPWVVIRVRDSGIGIAPEEQEAVFSAFHQVDRGAKRTKSGTGLGLTISQRLARLMGGDLTLESEIGRGSTFSLWLPAGG